MNTQQQSIFHHTFEPPTNWQDVTLVQLCTDELFLRILKRFDDFDCNVSLITRQGSTLKLPNVRAQHQRPAEPCEPFSHYCSGPVFSKNTSGAGTVFVFSDLEAPEKAHRGDRFLDVYEDIFCNRLEGSAFNAALINEAEYWMSWEQCFCVDEVRVPATGELIPVSAWVVGAVKQRVVDIARDAATKGPLVEIGRLFGGTAVLMALALKESGSKSAVFSFDPYPHPYNDRFLKLYGVQDEVALCDMGGNEGARFWQTEGLPPVSLLHIDGDHAYEAVRRDISTWYPLLREGAVVMFDDYGYNSYKLAGSTRAIYEEVHKRPDRWTGVQSLGKSLVAVKRSHQ